MDDPRRYHVVEFQNEHSSRCGRAVQLRLPRRLRFRHHWQLLHLRWDPASIAQRFRLRPAGRSSPSCYGDLALSGQCPRRPRLLCVLFRDHCLGFLGTGFPLLAACRAPRDIRASGTSDCSLHAEAFWRGKDREYSSHSFAAAAARLATSTDQASKRVSRLEKEL